MKKVKRTLSRMTSLEQVEVEKVLVSHAQIPLKYSARQALLKWIAPRYQTASVAQKSLLLDQVVEMTGYARKSAIRLLNHPLSDTDTIQRSRLPLYGPEVQQALFLAWKAANYICAKRLVPFLPTLVPSLERHGHLQISEEHRHQLLSMSSATAERFLHTQYKPKACGISTTKAGSLLKHQIPIRTFAGWEKAQPGFLEADLVAHCGGHAEGSYLYTLTLTDVATGWTECLPLFARTSELVVKALDRARPLFPFPILGLDTDNGSEFINEDLVAYCEREHLTFTRGRPEQKNDQCFVEERNREVVRRAVGYDRLAGEQAAQQLGELYRALRLYVNCFHPSMKLLSKTSREEGKRMRRVYDPAKAPLQRLFLAGVLSACAQHELEDIAQALDPLALVDQMEQLQYALFRCAVPSVSCRTNSSSPLPRRFAVESCLAEPLPGSREEPDPGDLPTIPRKNAHALPPFLNWRRSSINPFASEWEHIHAWVCAHPERAAHVTSSRSCNTCFPDAICSRNTLRSSEVCAKCVPLCVSRRKTPGLSRSSTGRCRTLPRLRLVSLWHRIKEMAFSLPRFPPPGAYRTHKETCRLSRVLSPPGQKRQTCQQCEPIRTHHVLHHLPRGNIERRLLRHS